MSKPFGFSNSSAGPPPADFETRSVTAQISRSGLTGSLIRASSRFLSSASMKEFRSLNMVCLSYGFHLVRDRLRQGQGAATVLAAHQRTPLLADRVDEVGQLALERFLARDRQLASLDLRT